MNLINWWIKAPSCVSDLSEFCQRASWPAYLIRINISAHIVLEDIDALYIVFWWGAFHRLIQFDPHVRRLVISEHNDNKDWGSAIGIKKLAPIGTWHGCPWVEPRASLDIWDHAGLIGEEADRPFGSSVRLSVWHEWRWRRWPRLRWPNSRPEPLLLYELKPTITAY